jgi:cyclopropane-fatty-acyl-phospholipid synthase
MTYGNGESGINARITIVNMEFFRKCVFYGAVGFGESFVDGDWKTDNLTDVISWMIDNHAHHPTMGSNRSKSRLVNLLNWFNIFTARLRKNSLKGSQRNIMDHYDLGNEFFETFLDPTMAYSSAYFADGTTSLEEAQVEKFEQLCQKLKLKPSDHLLEIGTGWGGFAIHAAENYGCRVTTTTISREQYAYAKNRFKVRGLSEQIEIKMCDYRKLTGQYDKIVSIEMIEAVGHEFLSAYFTKCSALLKRNGMLALQMILFPDNRYDKARRSIDWIQKYIFPGSLLPSNEAIQKAMKKTGQLGIYNYEDVTLHYVKTLRIWHDRFIRNINKIEKLGKNEEFQRKWIYYLCYCEAAFRMRHISVAQAVYVNSNNEKLYDQLELELSIEDQQELERINNKVVESEENL